MVVIAPNSVVSYYSYIGYFSYFSPPKNQSNSDRLLINLFVIFVTIGRHEVVLLKSVTQKYFYAYNVCMQVEWDSNKAYTNFQKHGIWIISGVYWLLSRQIAAISFD